jgi:hypothetical protein
MGHPPWLAALAAGLLLLGCERSQQGGGPAGERRAGEPLRLYPTVAGGREWFVPDDAELNGSGELAADQPSGITIVAHGPPTVYHTDGVGPDAEIRLNVHSPTGKPWWRNVEMTAYYRVQGSIGAAGPPHTEMVVRGAFHTSDPLPKSSVNDAVPPPPGTVVWPWWDAFGAGSTLRGSAIGTSYHGNLYYPPGVGSPAYWAATEKEVSHVQGYCGPRARVTSAGQLPAMGRWFGEKVVVRNRADDGAVRIEVWLDPDATGTWVKLSEYTDQNGVGNDWSASGIDGTDQPPYSIASNQLLNWAGPYAGFRADNASLDFRQLSVREIAPY